MEVDGLEIIEVELKYCERCGALWLRPRGSEQAYCSECVAKMIDLPVIRKSKGSRRSSISRDLSGIEQSEQGLAGNEGGHA